METFHPLSFRDPVLYSQLSATRSPFWPLGMKGEKGCSLGISFVWWTMEPGQKPRLRGIREAAIVRV